MVPDRMSKWKERYTGRWWFEAKMPWLGSAPRIRIMIEIEEGWGRDCPPPPGQELVLNWRPASRPATAREVLMVQHSGAPGFRYAPPTAVTP